jgi:hypothetical protein
MISLTLHDVPHSYALFMTSGGPRTSLCTLYLLWENACSISQLDLTLKWLSVRWR